MYAVVDIETTGGYAAAHGITEIAIHLFDGERLIDRFETLINPNQPIPRYIQAMTGITDEMVADAPRFEEVAERVFDLLKGKVFVAHNVNFDYSFVKAHLDEQGFPFQERKLCTVRLSRKIFPGLPSYSLSNLCRSLQIDIRNHHRAGGDAAATTEVLRRLIKNDSGQFIAKSLQRNSKEYILPPHVPREHFDQLPYTPGVYYFHDDKGKVIYVGKARNIRYRVNSHFSNNSGSRQKQNFLRYIHAISFQACGTELMASILESSEIKRLWPAFNQSQKGWEDTYGLFTFEDQRGYLRVAIEKNKKLLESPFKFHRIVDGHTMIRNLIRNFRLCPKLCFLQTTDGECEGFTDGPCSGACRQEEKSAAYNARVTEAINSLREQPSFAIFDEGRGPDEQSCILVIRGQFYGMGYLPPETRDWQPEELKEYLTPYRENSFITNLVHSYAAQFPGKVRLWACES